MGHILYLTASYNISRLILNEKFYCLGICLFIFNPFLLELFSAARGYSLGLGFLNWGLYYFLLGVRDIHAVTYLKNVAITYALIVWAILAHLVFFQVFLSLIVIFFMIECIKFFNVNNIKENKLSKWRNLVRNLVTPLSPALLVLILVYMLPVLNMFMSQKLYPVASGDSFWNATVNSLITFSLYSSKYPYINPEYLIKGFGVSSVVLSFFWPVYKIFRKLKFDDIDKYMISIFWLFMVCVMVVVFQHYLLNVDYVRARKAAYFIVIFTVLFLSLWKKINSFDNGVIQKASTVLMYSIVIFVGIHFIKTANLTYFRICPYDASTKEAMRFLADQNKDHLMAINAKTIGGHWIYLPAINFYKVKYDMYWLNWARCSDAGCRRDPDPGQDYYLLSYNEEHLKGRNCTNGLELLKQYNLGLLKKFDKAGGLLTFSNN